MFGLIINNYLSEVNATAKYKATPLLRTVGNTDNREIGRIINPVNDIPNKIKNKCARVCIISWCKHKKQTKNE